MMNIDSSISQLKGVGQKTEQSLNKLGIYTVRHLLSHYPRNYDVYRPPVRVGTLTPGGVEAILVQVTKKPDVVNLRRLQVVTMEVADGSGSVQLKWYNMPFLRQTIQVGQYYVFRGRLTEKNHRLSMEQPEILTSEQYKEKLNSMQPLYPLTEGVSNKLLTKLVGQVLETLDLKETYLDEVTRRKYQLIDYGRAIRQIHFPENEQEMFSGRKRLVFDEFYFFALAIQTMKDAHTAMENHWSITEIKVCEDFTKTLPYPLTDAQVKAWTEIQNDLQGTYVMNRLLQGDVGSGKTIIAQLALLATAKSGYQGCLMAPTEVLARQHYISFVKDFEPMGIKVVLLTGSMTAKEKRECYEAIASHEADIIIGTHALIQEKVIYDQLALVITDEQHRFGVRQREFLNGKGDEPHVLVMSATPIPRTLAIILYGDLDISVIDQLPAARLPIKNCAVNTAYRPKAYSFIEKQVRSGHQVYVICPMVETSEMAEGENVIEYSEKLKHCLPSDIRIEYLHGKQKPKEKNNIMERFAQGEIDILVSTTVVEVGVNVPNATVMLIEDAQRFGLAQLHQLRGRVGRGDAQSYCIFINTSEKQDADRRLEVLVKSNDGFFIAGEDLKMRGPGDLFGLKQSGLMDFKIGDLFNDMDLLKEAVDAAKEVFEKDPEFKEHQQLKVCLDAYMSQVMEHLVL